MFHAIKVRENKSVKQITRWGFCDLSESCVYLLLCSREGMQLNNELLQLICLRFADANYDIDFDDYLTCIVRLENMFST